ncbi:MAG: hypothetical protein R6W77_16495 [Trueperaceae bacterium]
MKITIEFDDATVWSLLEASGKESLEEALEVAVASYIHRAQADHWSALQDLSFRTEGGEDPGVVDEARADEGTVARSDGDSAPDADAGTDGVRDADAP